MFGKRRKPPARPARATATASKPRPKRGRARLRAWFAHHAHVFTGSLGQLWAAPLSTLMTAAVIGIALAMPAGLYALLGNLQTLSSGWESAAQISVFLDTEVSDGRATALADEIGGWEGVERLDYVSPAEAMDEFQRQSGFGDILEQLEKNPLPGVLIIQPAATHTDPGRLEILLGRLEQLDGVDLAQLDMDWVRRLNAIIELGQHAVLLIAGLLGLAIVLVVGNTIRLTIFNRREEIVVTKLIGATDSFIRRPFLYTGFWYGVIGALIAWALVSGFIGLLSGPVSRLAVLYGSGFDLDGLGFTATAVLLAAGVALGYLGSWLAVGRHLRAIEPT